MLWTDLVNLLEKRRKVSLLVSLAEELKNDQRTSNSFDSIALSTR